MITIGRFELKAKRWPWQKGYNWRGMTNNVAPLNIGGARFGAGWKYSLGWSWGGGTYGWTLRLDLLFGMVTILYNRRKK